MLNPDGTGPLNAGLADVPIRSPVSRRSVLRGAAAAGAATAGAAAFGGYSLAGHEPAGSSGASSRPASRAGLTTDPDADSAAQLVVHISDARSGQLDIFHGTSQTTLRDPDLVARLVRASLG